MAASELDLLKIVWFHWAILFVIKCSVEQLTQFLWQVESKWFCIYKPLKKEIIVSCPWMWSWQQQQWKSQQINVILFKGRVISGISAEILLWKKLDTSIYCHGCRRISAVTHSGCQTPDSKQHGPQKYSQHRSSEHLHLFPPLLTPEKIFKSDNISARENKWNIKQERDSIVKPEDTSLCRAIALFSKISNSWGDAY